MRHGICGESLRDPNRLSGRKISCFLSQTKRRRDLEVAAPSRKSIEERLVRRVGHRIDVHTTSFAIKTHRAINKSENRVVAAETDVLAGQKLGSTLANDDVSSDDDLTAEFLDTKTLADAIASVLD